MDRERFFSLMSAFPTGVAIVTTIGADGEPKGLTTNAVSSISADPSLLLVSVDRSSRTLPALLESGRFVVNFMGHGRDAVCALFASRSEDKFSGVAWQAGRATGMPCLHEDAIAWAECATWQRIDAGDHVMLLGRVEDGRPPEPDASPLVYFKRAYGRWSAGLAAPGA